MTTAPETDASAAQATEGKTGRHEWVSVAAYFHAEKRGFEPDKQLDDWLQAELEYIAVQIKEFLEICFEDGEMTLSDLQSLAAVVGIKNPEQIQSVAALIREIQDVTKHRACFQTEQRQHCDDYLCQWRRECQKLIAVWNR